MQTEIRRIDLGSTDDLNQEIKNLCLGMGAGGYKLISTFIYQTHLVLIFQS